SQREAGVDAKLQDILAAKQFQQLPDNLQQHSSVQQLQTVLTRLKDSGVTNAMFDITIMRGFDYYTDIVFEVVDNDPTNNRSMMGGGRYDGLVGLFGVEPVPTVGFGFGDVTLAEFLKGHELLPEVPTETDVYVTFVGGVLEQSQKVIADLRGMGLNVAVDLSGRKLGDQFKAADKKGITYALVIGEKELAEERFTLKNLKTGVEDTHSLERIVSIIKDRRQED
ncbi:MAG: His/Gly/Thr/Pro-type tRNA ligase C-terminal domain-containing protein, partial [Candidatus Saccharimonadales bacterium]